MGSTEGTAEKNGARGRKRAAPVVEEAPRAPRSRIVGLRTLPLERIDRFGFGNPKHMTEEVRRALHTSLDEFGTILPLIARPHPSGDPGRVELIDGHHRLDDFAARGDTVAEVLVVDVPDDMRARALLLAIKGIQADFDPEALPAYIEGLIAETDATQEWLASVSAVDLSFLETEPGAGEAGAGEGGEVRATDGHVNLGGIAERFLVPPFTVLDARAGWWRERKQAWLSLGIKSEVGRGGAAPGSTGAAPTSGAWLNRRGDGSTAPADPKWKKGAPAAKGLAVKDVAGYVPDFYQLKTALERKLGREVSKGEFEREHFPAILAARGNDPRYSGNISATGTSVFDPVLCELSFRWFSPPGGSVLDPFAGGSVRGVVAAALGRAYTGIELRPEQVAANREQWAAIGPRLRAAAPPPPAGAVEVAGEQTPVERRGNVWVKRDDLFRVAGVSGGKVRSCWHLAQGATGLVTAGSRSSPQVNIVAHVAKALGIPCRVHTPEGELSPEVKAAEAAGAEVVQHRAGYNTVIIKRARDDAKKRGWREIPFGMECTEAVTQTRAQVASIAEHVRAGAIKRVVMPVGSGMSLAGVLHGLRDHGLTVPVVGVVVGSDPKERLARYAPAGWESMVELRASGLPYDKPGAAEEFLGLRLDPIYEAKCLPFMEPDDLLWVVGIRQTAEATSTTGEGARPVVGPDPVWVEGDSTHAHTLAPGEYDLLFSCPPYADLEVYSDDPRDLSAMSYPDFLATYRTIIARSVAMLRPDRFAVWVVGDVRDPRGMYRGLVADTIAAFRAAGAELYNEAVLVTPVGSLPVRVGRQFAAARKLGKTHQNVLVFVKGDPKKATAACGAVEVGEVPYGEEITEEEVVEDEPERTNPETAEEAPPPRA